MRKRILKVGQVFRHENRVRQRKITDIFWDTILYKDAVWFWQCKRSHFLKKCPKEVHISDKDLEIAIKVSWKENIELECENWIYAIKQHESENWRVGFARMVDELENRKLIRLRNEISRELNIRAKELLRKSFRGWDE